jgi:hypothetical protein
MASVNDFSSFFVNVSNTQNIITVCLFAAVRTSNIREKDSWIHTEGLFACFMRERIAVSVYYA